MGMDMGGEPPMPDGTMDGGGMPMDGGMPMPPQDGMQGNEFDTDFDAGVEADEEQDPKKYIQQLTGKLSQTLRKYNSDLGQPDVDLNKYVAGMINKQATEGLSEDDVEEILNKVKSGEPVEGGEEMPQMDMQQPPMDDMQQQQQPPQQPMMNESFKRNRNQLSEIIDSILNLNKSKEDQLKKVDKPAKRGYKGSVYTSSF
jgi:hypothetical protein